MLWNCISLGWAWQQKTQLESLEEECWCVFHQEGVVFLMEMQRRIWARREWCMGTNGIISASKLNTEHSRTTLSETRRGNTHVKPHQLCSRQNVQIVAGSRIRRRCRAVLSSSHKLGSELDSSDKTKHEPKRQQWIYKQLTGALYTCTHHFGKCSDNYWPEQSGVVGFGFVKLTD